MCAINSVCDSLETKSRNGSTMDSPRICPLARTLPRCPSLNSAWKGYRRWVILGAQPMTRSLHRPIAAGRKMGASVCLLAVLVLWAPLGAMALQANGIGCCTAGFCARAPHGHQRGAQAPPVQPAAAETSMGCEHHGGA